ncbi:MULTISPECIES: hypothetical protein [Nostoc]|uniref:Uncharacterized protein n=1 Tax=Nostoc punctiforme FACHB-252 TaxID=1357509 RepID=A0ABR8HI42_NOSPU|nr:MULTISPECIES: hypothetical protein [Nostoc]MBC1236381.1 hypothetical protein [Nostoc sp. 2RC]MBD2615203.1 hypothetical protein [Nostoc punctiforme FACHB-252]
MAQEEEFVENPSELQQYLDSENLNIPVLNQPAQNPLPKREPVKHLLMGSSKAVIGTIHHLQIIGYASVGDWSPLVRTGNADEVMSILIRQILMQ